VTRQDGSLMPVQEYDLTSKLSLSIGALEKGAVVRRLRKRQSRRFRIAWFRAWFERSPGRSRLDQTGAISGVDGAAHVRPTPKLDVKRLADASHACRRSVRRQLPQRRG
jgi:hypothetical protein